MSIDSHGIDSLSNVLSLLSGVPNFNPSSDPFKNQKAMAFREIGKMRDLYLKGPHPLSKVLTSVESWSSISNYLESVRSNLSGKGIFGVLSYIEGEGASVWGIIPDSTFTLEKFGEVLNKDMKDKKWATAFTTAQKEMEGNAAPFAISFVASMTLRTIPFFGRVKWGVAIVDEIISLTQVPTMVSVSASEYFTWSFVPKKILSEDDLYGLAGGKNGGERDYTRFKDFREYLLTECEPLNPQAKYSFANESILLSQRKSRLMAELYLHPVYEDDDTDEDTGGDGTNGEDNPLSPDSRVYPRGDPFLNKLNVVSGSPNRGPLY